MNHVYTSPSNPGSFGGLNRLYAAARNERLPTTISKARKFLQTSDAYTLHKPRRYKYPRNKFIIRGIDDLWQGDLADFSTLSRYNDGYRYVLVVIDSLTKYVWIAPLVKKDATTTMTGMIKILDDAAPRKPDNFLVDKGGEFRNQALLSYMRKRGINFYFTKSPDTKAAIAERVIRTIKSKVFRYLTQNNTWRYLDVLPNIVESYNASKHRTTGYAPKDVREANVPAIKQRMYGSKINVKPKYNFHVGDQVRLANERGKFQKGYKPGWTVEIFSIAECLPRNPPVYRIKDAMGEMVEGVFYAQELQKVIKTDNVYKIERIIDQRRARGRTEYLIKWLGYPESMATWEPKDNIQLI